MHEAGIAKSILDAALRALPDQAKRITKITVAAGAFAGFEEESLSEHFPEMANGTRAEGATLEIKRQNAVLRCSQCGNEEIYSGVGRVNFECAVCGGMNILQGGDRQLYLDSIEVADEPAASA